MELNTDNLSTPPLSINPLCKEVSIDTGKSPDRSYSDNCCCGCWDFLSVFWAMNSMKRELSQVEDIDSLTAWLQKTCTELEEQITPEENARVNAAVEKVFAEMNV
ncbi:MAG: hypothetical protein K940chlam6_00156 [Chlamydiae bacterium]|nr:hypothetical protein [Chlamydiota bacterium]